jgi:hypothetical protein
LCGDPHVEADASPQDDGGKEGWNCLRMTGKKDDGKKEIWRYIFVASAEKAWHSRVMLN